MSSGYSFEFVRIQTLMAFSCATGREWKVDEKTGDG